MHPLWVLALSLLMLMVLSPAFRYLMLAGIVIAAFLVGAR
jgi:hypothetical protein